MGQAKEVERGSIRIRMACALCSPWAEIDEAGLVRVEREPEPCKTFVQYCQDTLSVGKIAECHQRIVGVPHKGAIPGEARSHLSLEPVIQHVVQTDVREAGRDYTPLRGALSRTVQETLFDGSCLQPLVDHSSDDAVRNSPVEEGTQV
jgi:hypothetical protein